MSLENFLDKWAAIQSFKDLLLYRIQLSEERNNLETCEANIQLHWDYNYAIERLDNRIKYLEKQGFTVDKVLEEPKN